MVACIGFSKILKSTQIANSHYTAQYKNNIGQPFVLYFTETLLPLGPLRMIGSKKVSASPRVSKSGCGNPTVHSTSFFSKTSACFGSPSLPLPPGGDKDSVKLEITRVGEKTH